jgi:hypothetical protein
MAETNAAIVHSDCADEEASHHCRNKTYDIGDNNNRGELAKIEFGKIILNLAGLKSLVAAKIEMSRKS